MDEKIESRFSDIRDDLLALKAMARAISLFDGKDRAVQRDNVIKFAHVIAGDIERLAYDAAVSE